MWEKHRVKNNKWNSSVLNIQQQIYNHSNAFNTTNLNSLYITLESKNWSGSFSLKMQVKGKKYKRPCSKYRTLYEWSMYSKIMKQIVWNNSKQVSGGFALFQAMKPVISESDGKDYKSLLITSFITWYFFQNKARLSTVN